MLLTLNRGGLCLVLWLGLTCKENKTMKILFMRRVGEKTAAGGKFKRVFPLQHQSQRNN